MPISSRSQVATIQDPILENDLELLAKVNTFEQAQFNEGEKELQNEVDNWALLANVAKPQDREYINKKLNKLVTGINNLGGVNLADVNNVNSLKSLGYNVYGDNNILNAVSTTKKMQTLQADAKAKFSSKNAKDYDPTYYEYQLHKYDDWLKDGQVGSAFDGPMQLDAGSFEQYQKRMEEAVNKLEPDANEAPEGDLGKLGYFQIGSKFIKKERVNNLIESLTTAHDREIITAHAWKDMGGLDNDHLVSLQAENYDNKIEGLQQHYNQIAAERAITKDPEQQKRYDDQLLNQIPKAIKRIKEQKDDLLKESIRGLDKDHVEQIRSNLYFDAYKEGYSSSKAYDQDKVELKYNQGVAFIMREARGASEFAQTQALALRKQDFEEAKFPIEMGLKASSLTREQREKLGITGIALDAPLTLMTNIDPATGSNRFTPESTVEAGEGNFVAASSNFYTQGYNYLAGTDANVQKLLVKNNDGNFVPKNPEAVKVLQNVLDIKYKQLDKLATTPFDQRPAGSFTSEDQKFFYSMQELKQAKIYKEQLRDLDDKAFKKAYGDNESVLPQNKTVQIDFANGQHVTLTYAQLKRMQVLKDPRLDEWSGKSKFKRAEFDAETGGVLTPRDIARGFEEVAKDLVQIATLGKGSIGVRNSLQEAVKKVNEYYNDTKVKKGYEWVSQTYNPYGQYVSLPKDKSGNVLGDWDKFLFAKTGSEGVIKDIDLLRTWVRFDNSQPEGKSKDRYMAEVIIKKGSEAVKGTGDKTRVIDLTDDLANNPLLQSFFPDDDETLVRGMQISRNGMTPAYGPDAMQTISSPQNTIKYQLIKTSNGYKVKAFWPRKDGGVYTIDVQNKYNKYDTSFENNINAVKTYMNTQFSTPEGVEVFRQTHKIPKE